MYPTFHQYAGRGIKNTNDTRWGGNTKKGGGIAGWGRQDGGEGKALKEGEI